MLVIETTILICMDGEIIDHQSRIVDVHGWDEYVYQYINNVPLVSRGTMNGISFKESWEMLDLVHDDTQLSAEFIDEDGFGIFKLAYVLDDGFELNFVSKKEMYLC